MTSPEVLPPSAAEALSADTQLRRAHQDDNAPDATRTNEAGGHILQHKPYVQATENAVNARPHEKRTIEYVPVKNPRLRTTHVQKFVRYLPIGPSGVARRINTPTDRERRVQARRQRPSQRDARRLQRRPNTNALALEK